MRVSFVVAEIPDAKDIINKPPVEEQVLFVLFKEVLFVGTVIEHCEQGCQNRTHCGSASLEPVRVSKFKCVSSHNNAEGGKEGTTTGRVREYAR